MITEDEQKLVQTLANVFDNLQGFLIQKNHQHIIYGFLQIKKLSRRGFGSSNPSIEKRSVASVSQKNYSERKKSVSRNSARKSVGKQSHASFDIIKGAEFFNQSRKNRPHYQKQYTQVSKYQRPYMDNQNDQPTRFTGPYNNNKNHQILHRNNTPQIVPKLVGLVSSDQISDIQRPSKRTRVNHEIRISQRVNDKGGLSYDRSILQVQDDDDEFQDVVLNRLDQIQQKVNQMLKDKKKQKLQAGNLSYVQPRPPMTPTHQYPPKSRLQNVNSGPNIIYTNTMRGHRNSEFYKYQQPRHNVSSDQMISNPQVYSFQNTKNNSYAVLNKRISETNGIRPQFTQRAHKLSQRILSQMPQYVTDNQQYGQSYQHPYRRDGSSLREAQTVIIYQQNLPFQSDIEQQNILIKNKRLGHYRDSSGTIRYTTQSSQQRPSYSRDQQVIQKQSDYSRIRQQAFIDGQNVYKYIPMARQPEKTQRHVITRKVERRGKDQHNDQEIYQRHRVGEVVFIDNLGRQVIESNRSKQSNYAQHINQARDDLYHKSSQNSGIRYRPLEGSNIKAYTDQGDFIPSADDFSVSSDGGIYSEIRQLRQITKQHGIGKGERREGSQNRNILDRNRLVIQKQYPQKLQQQINEQDYRHHQKTQRNRYLPSRKYSQHTGQDYTKKVIIERGPMQQRVYKVIRQVPYVQKQQIMISNRSRATQQPVESSQYVQYVPVQQKMVYRTVSHNGSLRSNQPLYVNNQGEQKYQRIPHNRKTKQTQFRTIVMKDDNRSQKKLSTGSINTFKSIPYRSDTRKNTIKEMMEQDKNIEFVQSQSNQQRQQEQQSQQV